MDTIDSRHPPSPVRRCRPHPARRARKIAGGVCVASMVVLTAGLAVVSHPKTSTASVATTAAIGQSYYALSQRSFGAAAIPARASSLAVTSSHAS